MQNEPSQRDERRLETVKGHPGIYKRGGRYVVVVRVRGKQVKLFASSLAEAREKKASLTADRDRGEYRKLSRSTFDDYAREWLETYTGRTALGVREGTMRDYRSVIERRAIPFFGRLRLAEIEVRDVKRYVAEVAATGVARDTIRLALAPVRALFATALEDGLIRSNPATGVRIPAPAETDQPHEEQAKALTEEELRRLFAETPEEWRPLVRVLADTGLRIGEAIALRWQDVDLGRRRLQVRRRFYRGSFAPPKSKYGLREIPLSAGVARELWRIRGSASEDTPVFPGRRPGMPLDASTAFRAVKSAAKAAGVGWAGPHTLRHTCATRLFRAGLNAKQVQLWLGHHSPAFTLATYVHLLADDLPDPAFLDELAAAADGEEEEAASPAATTERATGAQS